MSPSSHRFSVMMISFSRVETNRTSTRYDSLLRQTVFGLLFATLALTGCKNTGYHKSNRASADLESSAYRIESAALRLDSALAALDQLIQHPAQDLRPQFSQLSTEVKAAESLPSAIDAADRDMQSNGDAYFETWDKELTTIQNEFILAKSRVRKLEVLTQFNDARRHCAEVRTKLAPVLNDLKDVRNFLETDLTAGGRTAISDEAARLAREASPVRESVTQLVAELRALSAATSSRTPVVESAK